MKSRFYHLLFVFFLVIGVWFTKNLTMQGNVTDELGLTFELERPIFVDTAHAHAINIEMQELDLGALLDSEAGISAYYQAPQTIDLAQIRSLYKTIEQETSSYILGSIAVPNYNHESFDVHVYVNTNGWVLAYYMRGDPVSKVVDLYNYSIENTTLRTVIALVTGTAGVSLSDVTYYHFGFPNATNILFVYENAASGGNDFTINLPGSFAHLERTWTLRAAHSSGGCTNSKYFQVNGVNLSNTFCSTGVFASGSRAVMYGPIQVSQMLPDTTHTVTVSHWGVLAILYRIPE
jgi:hypothetical protein